MSVSTTLPLTDATPGGTRGGRAVSGSGSHSRCWRSSESACGARSTCARDRPATSRREEAGSWSSTSRRASTRARTSSSRRSSARSPTATSAWGSSRSRSGVRAAPARHARRRDPPVAPLLRRRAAAPRPPDPVVSCLPRRHDHRAGAAARPSDHPTFRRRLCAPDQRPPGLGDRRAVANRGAQPAIGGAGSAFASCRCTRTTRPSPSSPASSLRARSCPIRRSRRTPEPPSGRLSSRASRSGSSCSRPCSCSASRRTSTRAGACAGGRREPRLVVPLASAEASRSCASPSPSRSSRATFAPGTARPSGRTSRSRIPRRAPSASRTHGCPSPRRGSVLGAGDDVRVRYRV